jgi:hypothetical protein
MSASGFNPNVHRTPHTARPAPVAEAERARSGPSTQTGHLGFADDIGIGGIRLSAGPAAGRTALPHVGSVTPAYDFSATHDAEAFEAPPPPPPMPAGAGWTPGIWRDEQPSGHTEFAQAASAPSFFDQHPGLAPVAAAPTMEMTAAMKALEMTRKSLQEVQSATISINGASDLIKTLALGLESREIKATRGLTDKGKFAINMVTHSSGHVAKYALSRENVDIFAKIHDIKLNVEMLKAKLGTYPEETDLKQKMVLLQKLVNCHTEDALKQFRID